MTLVEISEREVIEAAKAWAAVARSHGIGFTLRASGAEDVLFEAVTLLLEREKLAPMGDRGLRLPPYAGPPVEEVPFPEAPNFTEPGDGTPMGDFPAPSAPSVKIADLRHATGARSAVTPTPLVRPGRKLSRREREIEKRRQSDPLATERDDIDYSSDELPSVR